MDYWTTGRIRRQASTSGPLWATEPPIPRSPEVPTQQLPPVVIRSHDQSAQLVYLDTSPDLATVMGKFRPARYVGARGGAYVLTASNLGLFADFAKHHRLQVVDERGSVAALGPLGREAPLPECDRCGQPARRGSRLAHCPGCGNRWQPIEITEHWRDASTDTCPTCATRQPAGYGWCIRCGAAMPAHTPMAVISRGHTEPVPIGAVLPSLEVSRDERLAAARESEQVAARAVVVQRDSQ